MDRDRIGDLLAEQDWGDIQARLVKFARTRGAPADLAEDKAQEAIERVFAFNSEWDPERGELLPFLMSVVRMLLFKERRAGKRFVHHDHHAEEEEGEREHADPRAVGPERIEQADLHERRIVLLRARLERRGEKEALVVLDLALEGKDKPADIREATGWSDADVEKFRLRMQRAALQVAEDLAGEEVE